MPCEVALSGLSSHRPARGIADRPWDYQCMNTNPEEAIPASEPHPTGRPDRMVLLRQMLEGTKRHGVPIRSEFLQKPRGAGRDRGNMLGRLHRNERALDAYLLIHAMASSSEPHDTKWPIETWTQVARYEHLKVADQRAAWSKTARVLIDNQLISKRLRRHHMDYTLLHESGSGEPYTRPKSVADGTWFTLPYAYWLDGWDEKLTFAEKRMLLIALDQQDGFTLPQARVPDWYSVSESSAQEGLAGLAKRAILMTSDTYEASARSPTGWRPVVRYWTRGAFSLKKRTFAGQVVEFMKERTTD